MFCLVSSHSILKLVGPFKCFDYVLAFWVACFKNMLIYLRFFVGLMKDEVFLIIENCAFIN
jgi:hypothetical protein